MLVATNKIRPSQDFLKPGTVSFILKCIRSGNIEQLPPPPLIREDLNGNFVAIDGHNLIAVRAFLKQSVEVHVAKSPGDGLAATSQMNVTRNQELIKKFDSALIDADVVAAGGIKDFMDLVKRHKEFFEL